MEALTQTVEMAPDSTRRHTSAHFSSNPLLDKNRPDPEMLPPVSPGFPSGAAVTDRLLQSEGVTPHSSKGWVCFPCPRAGGTAGLCSPAGLLEGPAWTPGPHTHVWGCWASWCGRSWGGIAPPDSSSHWMLLSWANVQMQLRCGKTRGKLARM